MKILCIETTGPIASVALNIDGEIKELSCNSNFSHLQEIAPLAERILRENNISGKDLDAIAVSRGPGSFTGVRIGVASVKALALIWKLPVIEVPTLESFIFSPAAKEGYILAPLFDARRNQVYAAALENFNILISEGAFDLNDFLAQIVFFNKGIVFCGDGAERYKEDIAKFFDGKNIKFEINPQLQMASADAKLAEYIWKKDLNYKGKGAIKDCYTVCPEYLREAEAERKLKEKI